MSWEAWQSTMYGVFDNGDNIFPLDEERCKQYWDTHIPEAVKNHILEWEGEDSTYVERFRNYESDDLGIHGPFALISDSINADNDTAVLGITADCDENGVYGLGVYEWCAFPWEMSSLANEAKKNNITFDRVTDAITQHVTTLYGDCPPLDDYTLHFSG